jgi:hypothetical protein
MSASLTSGTYGRQPALSGSVRQFLSAVVRAFGKAEGVSYAASAALSRQERAATSFRTRIREANDVRELARSVELHSPGFAADLYAAASRHEGLDD